MKGFFSFQNSIIYNLLVWFLVQTRTRDPLIRMALVLSKILPRKLAAAQYKYLLREAGKFLGFHISS